MGLFSKSKAAPVVHPPVERIVYVRASEPDATAHLSAYSSLFSPRHSSEHQLRLAVSGGWSAIRLPDAVHPWQLHNLAYWMLDCEGADQHVIAWSAAAPHHPGYRLVRDPDVPDALCGWDDSGDGWTVQVPANDIVRPEPVPVPRALSYPSGFHSWRNVAVRLEDPTPDLNPGNEPTFPSRKSLRSRNDIIVF